MRALRSGGGGGSCRGEGGGEKCKLGSGSRLHLTQPLLSLWWPLLENCSFGSQLRRLLREAFQIPHAPGCAGCPLGSQGSLSQSLSPPLAYGPLGAGGGCGLYIICLCGPSSGTMFATCQCSQDIYFWFSVAEIQHVSSVHYSTKPCLTPVSLVPFKPYGWSDYSHLTDENRILRNEVTCFKKH